MQGYPRESDAGLPDVSHLHRLWSRHVASGRERRVTAATDPLDPALDHLVIFGLGLGLHETFHYLFFQRPSFEAFQSWILACNGGVIDPARIARVNAAVASALGQGAPVRGLPADFVPVFDDSDLRCWAERGYVVLRNAVAPEACQAAERAIWEFLGMDPESPDGWYDGANLEGIMVTLVRHPAFDANRQSPRLRKAFAQLWGTDDLQVSVDRGGFNPPERPNDRFRGSDLHWDTSLARPIPLRLQGILYLTETPADQGAFRCVPGFHRRIESWLTDLPPGADPRAHDFSAEAVPIAGKAGDFVIWDARLPHGASPNRGTRPRLVQYIACHPPGEVDLRPWV